jgi:hypothetical protein
MNDPARVIGAHNLVARRNDERERHLGRQILDDVCVRLHSVTTQLSAFIRPEKKEEHNKSKPSPKTVMEHQYKRYKIKQNTT